MARNLESKVVDRIISELEKLPVHRRVDVLDYVKTRVKGPAVIVNNSNSGPGGFQVMLPNEEYSG